MVGFLSGFVSLFASTSTLLCCALPALMVAVGAGASLAGLVSTFPSLIWLSEHKELSFGVSTVLLGVAGWLQWRSRFAPCPIDPALAAACMRTRKLSLRVYLFSVGLFLIGLFFAYAAPYLNE
jgi:hypothetical protein